MTNVGIDVSKDHLDWTADTEAPVQRVANRPAGVRRLVRRLSGFEVARVVVEATGGYERLLVEGLAAPFFGVFRGKGEGLADPVNKLDRMNRGSLHVFHIGRARVAG